MNKKLLTMVVGAALVAGPMIASAAGPTVFGGLHVSIDRFDNDAQGTTIANEQGFLSTNFSRVGVKGDDDLGGGMKSVYQILVPLRVDDGTSGLGGTLYDTFVGLSGVFGTVRLGRIDSPVKDLSTVVNPFGTRVGDSRNITGRGGSAIFDNRFSNAVRYDSPKFAGVTFAAEYSSDENAAAASDATSANVRWSGFGLNLGLGYEKHNTQTAVSANNDETIIRLVGNYKIGPATVAALYEKMEDLAGVAGADRDSMGASVTFKVGDGAVKALYMQTDKVDTNATDNGGKLIAVGYDHTLSKSTTVYAVYATIDNEVSGTFHTAAAGAHGNSLPTVAGQDQSALSVGMVINF